MMLEEYKRTNKDWEQKKTVNWQFKMKLLEIAYRAYNKMYHTDIAFVYLFTADQEIRTLNREFKEIVGTFNRKERDEALQLIE